MENGLSNSLSSATDPCDSEREQSRTQAWGQADFHLSPNIAMKLALILGKKLILLDITYNRPGR